jgi:hypothetical protein
MIAEKLLPSFYIIDVEGKAVESIIPGNFGIKSIAIGSLDFNNDMVALAALSTAIEVIATNPELDTSKATEQVDYNPEFFPTLAPIKMSDVDAETIKEANETVEEELKSGSNRISIPITRIFDPIGDFVSSRWTIDAPDFKIKGRVVTNPDSYLIEKLADIGNKPVHKAVIH